MMISGSGTATTTSEHDVAGLVDALQQSDHHRLVLIIDGYDEVQGSGNVF